MPIRPFLPHERPQPLASLFEPQPVEGCWPQVPQPFSACVLVPAGGTTEAPFVATAVAVFRPELPIPDWDVAAFAAGADTDSVNVALSHVCSFHLVPPVIFNSPHIVS